MNNENKEFKSVEEEQAAREFNAQQSEVESENTLDIKVENPQNAKIEKVDNKNESESQKLDRQIDDFYASYAKFAEVGSKEEYKEYLETIFPNSKAGGIYYRGAGVKSVDSAVAGTNQTVHPGAVFYTSNKFIAGEYRKSIANKHKINTRVYTAKLDLESPLMNFNIHDLQRQVSLEMFLLENNQALDGDEKSFLASFEKYFDIMKYDDDWKMYATFGEEDMNRHEIQAVKDVYSLFKSDNDRDTADKFANYLRINTSDEESRNKFYAAGDEYFEKNYDGIMMPESNQDQFADTSPYDQVAVFDPDQVHLLGSFKDLNKFRDFVNENRQEA